MMFYKTNVVAFLTTQLQYFQLFIRQHLHLAIAVNVIQENGGINVKRPDSDRIKPIF